MFDANFFDDMAKKLYQSLPTSLQHMEQDIQSKFREVLQSTFDKLNLVTREEFDVQTKVLQRTREKVEAIEALLNQKNTDNAE